LCGSPVFDTAADCSPDWRSRALTEALGFYVFELSPYFAKPDSYLVRADIERRFRKIARLLAPVLEASGEKTQTGKAGAGIPARIAATLGDLETAAAFVDGMDRAAGFEGSPVRIPYCGSTIAVCGDSLTAEEIAPLLAAAQPPVIMTPKLFGYFARKYNPYDYDYLCRGGANSIAGLTAPTADDFATYLRSRLAHALLFTRGPDMFPKSGCVDADDLHAEAKRLMGIQLLSEKRLVIRDWLELEARWRDEYPEQAAMFSRILIGARNRERTAQREAFQFFRTFARMRLT
jgi:hypothetical protein